jgi:hypothetical protein
MVVLGGFALLPVAPSGFGLRASGSAEFGFRASNCTVICQSQQVMSLVQQGVNLFSQKYVVSLALTKTGFD